MPPRLVQVVSRVTPVRFCFLARGWASMRGCIDPDSVKIQTFHSVKCSWSHCLRAPHHSGKIRNELPLEGMNKMAAIMLTTFSDAFSWNDILKYDKNVTAVWSWESIWAQPSLLQEIAWHYAGNKSLPEPVKTQFTMNSSPGLNELTLRSWGLFSIW